MVDFKEFKMKYIYMIWIGLACLLGHSCKEDFNTPLQQDGVATAAVTNVQVKNMPGGAILTYTIPKDPNLLYVMAEVPMTGGRTGYFKSSSFKDNMEIFGIPDENSRSIKVYAVSKGEVKSAPVDVVIHPLTPPYIDVLRSLKVNPDFGGINIKYDNETGADLAFMLERLGDDGKWIPLNGYYSKLKEGNHSFRGIEAVETQFAIYVKDRWDNISDTLYTTVTPIYEKMLDKGLFKDITLPGDSPIYTTEWNIGKRYVWDGTWSSDFSNPYGNWYNVSTNAPNDGTPSHITIDIGINAKLSRFRINHYYRFIDKGMRRYEIWGRPDTPKDGSWEGWTKMANYEQKKPSGLAGESYTAEDAEVWLAGDNGDFSSDLPAMRYIRIRCLENWIGTTNLCFAELTLYGNDKF
jgi:hypothetical protein